MLAIKTRTIGQTTHKGTRVAATGANGQRVVIPYEYSGIDQAHAKAAQALCEKYKWHGDYVGGWLNNNEMAWVSTRNPTATIRVRADMATTQTEGGATYDLPV